MHPLISSPSLKWLVGPYHLPVLKAVRHNIALNKCSGKCRAITSSKYFNTSPKYIQNTSTHEK